MTSIPQVGEAIRRILTEEADQLAREVGFIQAVVDPTGLLAGSPSQPGQGGAGRAARGGSADDGSLSGWRRSDRGLDRALYAVGLSLEYAQDLSEHLAVLAGDSAGLASTSETTEKSLNLMCMGTAKVAPTIYFSP